MQLRFKRQTCTLVPDRSIDPIQGYFEDKQIETEAQLFVLPRETRLTGENRCADRKKEYVWEQEAEVFDMKT